MSRRPNPIPSIRIGIMFPQDLYAQLQLHLFSELEGRVPLGAYQEFFCARIREFFGREELDLAPWTGEPAKSAVVVGSPGAIKLLKEQLNGRNARYSNSD